MVACIYCPYNRIKKRKKHKYSKIDVENIQMPTELNEFDDDDAVLI